MGDVARIECHRCRNLLPRKSFPRRRLATATPVCASCRPPVPGRIPTKKLRPDTEYGCDGCGKSLAPDWFDVKTMRGEKWVIGNCRACKREEAEKRREGRNEEERKLRNDVLYDFDLARNMFGMSYEETVTWLERGYGHRGVDEEQIRGWGMTETRREIWEPDGAQEHQGTEGAAD